MILIGYSEWQEHRRQMSWLLAQMHSLQVAVADQNRKLEKIMTSLVDLKAAVASETGIVASVVTLLDQIKQMLDVAISANDPAAIQAVADGIAANSAALAAAVIKNTPVAEPDPVPAPDPLPEPDPVPVPDPLPEPDPVPAPEPDPLPEPDPEPVSFGSFTPKRRR